MCLLKRVESRIEYYSVYVKYSMGVLYTIPGSNIIVSQTFDLMIARLQLYIFYPSSCELNFWAIFFFTKRGYGRFSWDSRQLRAPPRHLRYILMSTEVSRCLLERRCCCCCFHIKNRSDLCSVPSNIRTGPTDANDFLSGHRLTTQKGTRYIL